MSDDNTGAERTSVPEDWSARLADAIAGALWEFAPQLGGEAIALLAVDCHPWHGSVGLSALTATEAAEDALLADPSEMAAWRHHDFAHEMTAWRPVAGLGDEMRAAYEAGGGPEVAVAYLRVCAAVVSSAPVKAALEQLCRADGFRVSVAHPDDGREFVPPGTGREDERAALLHQPAAQVQSSRERP